MSFKVRNVKTYIYRSQLQFVSVRESSLMHDWAKKYEKRLKMLRHPLRSSAALQFAWVMSFLPHSLILLGVLHDMEEEVDMLLVALHRNPLINAMISSEVARQEHRRVEPVHVVGQMVVMLAVRPAH